MVDRARSIAIVVAVFVRAVLGWLRTRARRQDLRDGRSGAVAIIQRFGAALNLNVHVHALVVDGVFVRERGRLRFRRMRAVAAGDVARLLETITRRIRALAALGARAGRPVRRWGDAIDPPVPEPERWRARVDGFDLHAGVAVSAKNRARLEQLCRYALRPAVGQNRLQLSPDGLVVLELRRRWTDGTTHPVFDPVELLERLAALVPRPRINQVLYYGVFAPRAAGRRAIVPGYDAGPHEARREMARRPANPTWAGLMRRSFRLRQGCGGLAEALRAKAVGFDVLACSRCAGRLRLIGLVHQPRLVRRILTHLGQSPERRRSTRRAIRRSRSGWIPRRAASGERRVGGRPLSTLEVSRRRQCRRPVIQPLVLSSALRQRRARA